MYYPNKWTQKIFEKISSNLDLTSQEKKLNDYV